MSNTSKQAYFQSNPSTGDVWRRNLRRQELPSNQLTGKGLFFCFMRISTKPAPWHKKQRELKSICLRKAAIVGHSISILWGFSPLCRNSSFKRFLRFLSTCVNRPFQITKREQTKQNAVWKKLQVCWKTVSDFKRTTCELWVTSCLLKSYTQDLDLEISQSER